MLKRVLRDRSYAFTFGRDHPIVGRRYSEWMPWVAVLEYLALPFVHRHHGAVLAESRD
jgi:hypothetical protein